MSNKNYSKRDNKGKLDLTSLSIKALLPQESAEHFIMKLILEHVENDEFEKALEFCYRLDPTVIEIAAHIMNIGEEIYGYHNWKVGMSKRSILQSLYRHVHAHYNLNEVIDVQSGYSHLGHIYCNLMFLQYHSEKGFLPYEPS